MTAIKGTTGNLVAIKGRHGTVLMYDGGPLTLDAARQFVGRRITLPTGAANETAEYTIEEVAQNRETGDVVAWVTRPGVIGGVHKRIVAKS